MLRSRTTRSTFIATVLALIFACQAHASALLAPGCDAAADSFKCRLTGVLNFLYVAAAVLAFVLLLVIVLAVRMYRKNRATEKNLKDLDNE